MEAVTYKPVRVRLAISLGAKTVLVHFTAACDFLMVYTGMWQSECLMDVVTAELPNVP